MATHHLTFRKHKPQLQPHLNKRVNRQLEAPLVHNIPLQLRTRDQDLPLDPTVLADQFLQQLKREILGLQSRFHLVARQVQLSETLVFRHEVER